MPNMQWAISYNNVDPVHWCMYASPGINEFMIIWMMDLGESLYAVQMRYQYHMTYIPKNMDIPDTCHIQPKYSQCYLFWKVYRVSVIFSYKNFYNPITLVFNSWNYISIKFQFLKYISIKVLPRVWHLKYSPHTDHTSLSIQSSHTEMSVLAVYIKNAYMLPSAINFANEAENVWGGNHCGDFLLSIFPLSELFIHRCLFDITFISDRCHCRLAVVTPDKYECQVWFKWPK